MNGSLLLRIICLVGVLVSGFLYLQVKKQKLRLDENLNISRLALQEELSQSAKLKSRTLYAEESSKQLQAITEEERAKATGFKEQFDQLKQRAEAAEAAQKQLEEELQNVNAANRDLQRENNNLEASIPPQNWREQLNDLQSRNLELSAENTSLRRSLSSVNQNPALPPPASSFQTDPLPTQSVGEVVRIGPDGSFAIINYGRQHGAAEGQTLSLRREQQEIALVSLTNITNDFSVAQILSATNTNDNLSVAEIQVGDAAHLE
ncbi:hypothetical protein F7C95_11155 [Opitutia bacterium ISCC 51]|nr:hypothetical protein F7C95_11155 [Opitutae bacterium ISCC 51]QXD26591.1 hypothetical protein GA003_11090 [Opitutae bacterium ISCC 52]